MATTRSDEPIEIPSTAEVTQTLETAKQELEEVKTAPEVDSTGRQIISDTERVLESAQSFIEEKNKGDVVQELVVEGRKAVEELSAQVEKLTERGYAKVEQIDVDRLKEQATRVLDTARMAGIELISSDTFRRHLKEFLNIMYDIVSHSIEVAQGGTQAAGPSTSTTSGTMGTKETTPTTGVSGEVKEGMMPKKPSTETTTSMPSTTKSTTGKGKKGGKGGKAPEEVVQHAKEQVKEAVTSVDTESVKQNLEEPINKGLQKAGVTGARVRLNKDQLDALVNRFAQFIDEISQDERLLRVFRELLNLFDLFSTELGLRIPVSQKYGARAKGPTVKQQLSQATEEVKQAITETTEEMRRNKHMQRALHLAKELFERFTGGRSLDKTLDHFYSIYRVIQKDTDAMGIVNELRDFFTKVLDDPKILRGNEGRQRFRRLIKRFRRMETRKVQRHLSMIITDFQDLIKSINNDPSVKRLKNDMQRLLNDLLFDQHGNLTLKPEVLNQLRVLMVRAVIDRMRIPLPELRSTDGTMVYKISNMVLSVKDIVPDRVIIEDRGRVELNLAELGTPAVEMASNRLFITIKGINLHIRDMDVKFKRLTFPRLEDRGRAKLDIDGDGMDITIELGTYPGSYRLFRIERLDCDVHNLNLELSGTSHDFLYGMFLPFVRNKVKTDIQEGVESMIRRYLDQLNRIAAKQLRKASQGMQQMTQEGYYNFSGIFYKLTSGMIGTGSGTGAGSSTGTSTISQTMEQAKETVKGMMPGSTGETSSSTPGSQY